jgi:predicted nucleic acid-binding protein
LPWKELASRLQILVKKVQTDYPEAMDAALATFATTKLDFVDCLLVTYNRHFHDKVVSFDGELNRLLR